MDLIVEQSNLYAVQENANKPLDLDRFELEQWLGLCMNMSISKIPNTRLHWSTSSLGNEKVSSVMSRDRWENIKMKFHLTDNSKIDKHDKLSKVRPGCTGKVSMFCKKCEVHLCCESKRNCFFVFHTQ